MTTPSRRRLKNNRKNPNSIIRQIQKSGYKSDDPRIRSHRKIVHFAGTECLISRV